MKSIKPNVKPQRVPTYETNRRCNICDEPIQNRENSLHTNRDAGFGNIGRAHNDCIAKILPKTKLAKEVI